MSQPFTVLLPALALAVSACGPAKPGTTVAAPATAPTSPPADVVEPAAAPPPAPSVEERRAALTALLDEQWQYTLRTHPELASILGDPRYNDQWSDLSPAARAQQLADGKAFLARFEAIDTSDFPEQELLSQQLMVRNLREEQDTARFEDWLMPINQFGGVHLGLAQLVSMVPLATVKDYEDYLARLEKVPGVFEQVTALMREGMAKKLMPPRVLLEECVAQAASLAAGRPEASPFARPVKKFPAGVPRADQARLRAAILAAVRTKVLPSYAAFTAFLRDTYVPQGREEPGLWALPLGDERYAARAKSITTTNLSPLQIHEIGLAEVAHIEEAQAAIGQKLGFATLDEFRKHIRTNRKLFSKSAAEILGRYRRHTAQMYEKLPSLFGRLPAQRMVVEEVEAYRAKQAAGAEYNQGTKNGSRPGVVRVNTYQPKKRLWIDMESTAYHEGVPGHHLQIALQQELPELPPFRQQASYVAFIEGWALYSERLGKEVGFFQDPYSDYGRLQDEMLRAIRLVVDTGLHAKKWPRDKVVQFFRDHSTIDEISIQAETNRYIAIPGQALGYKVGQLTILRLRESAQAELGAAFDLRAFHDELLGAGALPLDVLEQRLKAWIERRKDAAK
ncbi:MAG: DUF885 domain-containing protein [Kofleriaceae bacterium]